LYEYAAVIEGEGRHRDDLVYFRNDVEYKNLKSTELPKGDFGFTIARQFLFSAFSYFLYQQLTEVADKQLSGMASKHLKEVKYHLRHSKQWVLRLGDGTDESRERIQDAFEELWTYTDELFYQNEIDKLLQDEGLAADSAKFKSNWKELVGRSEEHTSELQSRFDLVCRLLLEKKKKNRKHKTQ